MTFSNKWKISFVFLVALVILCYTVMVFTIIDDLKSSLVQQLRKSYSREAHK